MIVIERKQTSSDVLRLISLASRIAMLSARSTAEQKEVVKAKTISPRGKLITQPSPDGQSGSPATRNGAGALVSLPTEGDTEKSRINFDAHELARNSAETRYKRAVSKFLAAAEHEALKEKQSKDAEKHLIKFWLVVMDSETAKAFHQSSIALGASNPSPAEIKAYADSRQELIKDFPGRVFKRLQEASSIAQEGGTTAADRSEAVRTAGEAVEAGEGARMASSEAQAVYGATQIRHLREQGYTLKSWVTMEDERVRPTHVECGESPPLPLDKPFPNGLQYPGDPNGGPEETVNCRCWLVGVGRHTTSEYYDSNDIIYAGSLFDALKHPRGGKGTHEGGQFTSKSGGIQLKRIGEGKDSKWMTHDDKEIPHHAKKLGIPPAWQSVRVAPDESHDLQAIGFDSKGREQRIYSDEFTKKQAALKFSRNKELIEKKDYIFKQNEENLKDEDVSVRENAACMKLIQQTGIRPGSDNDTGAKVKAYGATTLLGKHVVIEGENVSLVFTGKKGVALNIPVEDKSTAEMLKERKSDVGDDGKLFDTDDASLRSYSHSLDGGSFKPKDFRTLKGTITAIEEINKDPKASKSFKDYKRRVMEIAKKVAQKLGNTPTIALQSYINPFVFESIKPA